MQHMYSRLTVYWADSTVVLWFTLGLYMICEGVTIDKMMYVCMHDLHIFISSSRLCRM